VTGYFIEKEGIYSCFLWAEFVWQKHGFGSRRANPEARLTLRQVHSADIWKADGLGDREQAGDALVAGEPGSSIGVRTADCVPILLLDPVQRAVAAIHAGWRGTASEIATLAIARLHAEYGSDPHHVQAAIGPAIRACCYQVSADVAERFSAWPESVRERAGAKPHVDLVIANCTQMEQAGLQPAHIFDCDLCTACRPDLFFSYRREPHNPGRMISAISRVS
jgi:polyphenol oxidase